MTAFSTSENQFGSAITFGPSRQPNVTKRSPYSELCCLCGALRPKYSYVLSRPCCFGLVIQCSGHPRVPNNNLNSVSAYIANGTSRNEFVPLFRALRDSERRKKQSSSSTAPAWRSNQRSRPARHLLCARARVATGVAHLESRSTTPAPRCSHLLSPRS